MDHIINFIGTCKHAQISMKPHNRPEITHTTVLVHISFPLLFPVELYIQANTYHLACLWFEDSLRLRVLAKAICRQPTSNNQSLMYTQWSRLLFCIYHVQQEKKNTMLKCTCSSQAPMNMFLYSFFCGKSSRFLFSAEQSISSEICPTNFSVHYL